jgi:hypothetical protein
VSAPPPRLDPDSGQWIRVLSGTGSQREAGLARLHELLLRIARAELQRRSGQFRITGPELDDLAYQAAADALLAIDLKLGQFRGESRFTTWAYKFVIFEVSAKIGRHFWAHPAVPMDAEDWDRLPGRFGPDPARETAGAGRCRAPRGRYTAHPAAAKGLRRDRAQRRTSGRPGRRARFHPERDLQDNV